MNDKLRKKVEKLFEELIENTPERFYQAHGLKAAILDDINYIHMNVSNRRDGKSFTTTYILTLLALKLGFKLLFLATDERSQISYFNQMAKVLRETDTKYKEEYLEYRTIKRWYINIYYQSEHIATVIDFSEIESLKNESAFLSQFDILFYDEFIKSPYRYHRQEYYLIKMLYKSMNRPNKLRKLKLPKLLFAGNPTNFDSPVLAGFDLLNLIETQPLNTCETYHRNTVNLIIEKHKNEQANVKEENDMFPDENEDPNSSGDFVFNNYNIEKKSSLMDLLVIDLEDFYLYVYYTSDLNKILFEIKGFSSQVDFCSYFSGESESVIYLGHRFIRDSNKFERVPARYVNSYTKTFISDSVFIKSLNIYKIISVHNSINQKKVVDEQKYNNDLITMRTKHNLSKQFNLELL